MALEGLRESRVKGKRVVENQEEDGVANDQEAKRRLLHGPRMTPGSVRTNASRQRVLTTGQ